MIRITAKSIKYIACAILFKVILDWSYVILSKSTYDVEFVLDCNYVKLFLSYIVVLIEAGLIARFENEKAFLFRLILFFTMIPLASIYGMRDDSSIYFLTVSLSFIFVELVLFRVKAFSTFVNGSPNGLILYSNIKGSEDNNLPKLISMVCVVFVLATLALMYMYNGLPRISSLNLNNVYELRNTYGTSKYLNYMLSLTAYVLVPFGVARATAGSKKYAVVFWLSIQFLLFLWTGHKTWLLSIALLIGMVMFSLKKIKEITVFLFLTLLAAGGAFFSTKSSILAYIFTYFNRRVLLNPASLKYFYYDYFIEKGNDLIGVSGTILAPLFPETIVKSDYAYEISEIYTGIPSNANTGLFGGDFANIGVFVFVVTPILLFLLGALISRSSINCGRVFTIILFSYLAFSFNDQGIFQYFMDFKGIALVLLILLYKKSYEQNGCRITKKKKTKFVLLK